jgi:TonB family protein
MHATRIEIKNVIMKKFILTKLLTLIGFIGAFATPQVSSRLIYKGDTISVYLNSLPKDFYKTDVQFFESVLAVNVFGDKKVSWSTACGDGYLTSWEITDNQLYLTGIYSCCFSEDSIKADLSLLFKEKVVNGKVKADWVTQKNVHGGKGFILWNDVMQVWKQEYEFKFSQGKLLEIKTFDNSNSRKSDYCTNSFKLLEFIYSNIEWSKLPIQKEKISVIVTFSANENGKIDEVEVLRKSDIEIFNQEAVRVIKSIPDWDVIYLKGQLYRQPFNLPIIFSEENRGKYGK